MKINLAGYIVTWTPYAIVSLYSAFINPDHITPIISTLPALLAKSSVVWSTLLYMFTNKTIRTKVLESFNCYFLKRRPLTKVVVSKCRTIDPRIMPRKQTIINFYNIPRISTSFEVINLIFLIKFFRLIILILIKRDFMV